MCRQPLRLAAFPGLMTTLIGGPGIAVLVAYGVAARTGSNLGWQMNG